MALKAYSQDSKPNPFAEKTATEKINSLLNERLNERLNEKLNAQQKNSTGNLEKKLESKPDERYEFMKSVQINFYKAPAEIKENYKFDLIKSVNSNVKFGGFYNGSVNIQFSPAMFIQPFSFLSIYANHQKNLLIPMESISNNAIPLAVETTGMVLIENIVKMFAPPNKVVRGVTEFALKNCVSFIVYSIFNSSQASQNSGVFKHDFYYFSAGITF